MADEDNVQPSVEFNVNLAIERANTLLLAVNYTFKQATGMPDPTLDKNLMLATTIHKLVGAACAWKAAKVMDLGASLVGSMQSTMEDDSPKPPRNLAELKRRLHRGDDD